MFAILHDSSTREGLENIKSKYITLMREIVSVSPKEVKGYNQFFDSFIREFLAYKAHDDVPSLPVSFIWHVKLFDQLTPISHDFTSSF